MSEIAGSSEVVAGRFGVEERLRLDGKTALLVGGGGGGIGTETAVAFAQAGADLIVLDLSEEQLAFTVDRVVAVGGTVETHTVDVLQREALLEKLDEVLKRDVHILVNLVGGGHSPAPILDYPEEVFDEVVHRNMSYVFFASRAVARSMKERGIAGSIVNLTSVSGLSAAKNVSVYGVAKAGVVSLTDTMAVEWGRYGIRANAVAPGGTRTPRNYRLHGSESMDKAAEWNPLSRTPHGSDIAAAVLFLVSDLAKFVTGQVIVVDCGASVRRPHQGGADLPEN